MSKDNLEEYLQDILKKVEKVVEEEDDQVIDDLISYIHVSKDIIRIYKSSSVSDSYVEKAYCKINEAEEKVMQISRFKYKAVSTFDIREIFNTFIEGLQVFSKS